MALWGGLGQAATVAQLVGADIGGLISMIMQAAVTARQNRRECEQLARRAFMIAELLPHLQDPEVMRLPEVRRPLVGLDDTLREAHDLVMSCQERSAVYRLMMAGRQAERFREVQSRIDSYLLVFPFISHINITRRLDRIHREHSEEVAQKVLQRLLNGGEEDAAFTFEDLLAATNNFAACMVIGEGGFGSVYMGRLPDGRKVAIKRKSVGSSRGVESFVAEVKILSPIHHKHIIRLLGWCAPAAERLLVYEYMKNGTLHDHLHGRLSSSSPVTTSWRMRIKILLGVSRAIDYLHTHAERPVIHRGVKTSNILLDDTWMPRLTGFGLSLTWDPEYMSTGGLKPAIDVYNFGVVMLEVLTGKRVMLGSDKKSLVRFALPIIQAKELLKVLDRRPAPEPTPRQLQSVELVGRTAERCLQLQRKKRPPMSNVVAKLEKALELDP